MRSFLPAKPLKDDLPISNSPTDTAAAGPCSLRRRLSSLSLKIRPLSSSAPAAWPFKRTRSAPSMGEAEGESSLRRWWDRSVGWLLSRKPAFARDLEMNEEETAMLGWQSRGSWRHVIYKMRRGLRRLVGGEEGGAGKGFRYSSFDYAKNFDDGVKAGGI